MNLNLNYSYVIYNANYTSRGKIDYNDFNAICMSDLKDIDDVRIIFRPLEQTNQIIRLFYTAHIRYSLPFKGLWNSFLFNPKQISNKPFCFVILSSNLSLSFLRFLREKYPNCKLVRVHRDLIKYMGKTNPEYTEENIKGLFDLRLTWDEVEAKKYGLEHYEGLMSRLEIDKDINYPLSDVFFAGKAKNRLSKILESYEKLRSSGLKCEFLIFGAKKQDRKDLEGVTWLDSLLPYTEILYKTVNSRCLLDINQDGAVGFTSRPWEAVFYNKFLITDNQNIRNWRYFNEKYMQILNNTESIDPSFLWENDIIDYGYDGDISPIKLIKQIDDYLIHH